MPFFAPQISTNSNALAMFLRHQCTQLRTSAHQLTSEQARLTPTPSNLSISGLLLHNAQVVHGWLTTAMRAPDPTPFEMYAEISARIELYDFFSGAEAPEAMSLDNVLTIFDRAVAFIDEAELAVSLDEAIPGPNNPWLPKGLVITGRWVWLHLITEVARHAGHADIIREAIDGKISYELNFLADGGTDEEWAAEIARRH